MTTLHVIETDVADVQLNDDGAPSHVNDYQIVKMLGEGSFSKVYLCHNRPGMAFALKILNKSFLKRKREYKRVNGKMVFCNAFQKVQREVAIMKKLAHPNLVKLHEVIDSPEDDKMFLVLELIHCGQIMYWDDKAFRYRAKDTLHGVLGREIVRKCMHDVVFALEYLHTNHICHRDIKPENILIASDHVYKLADFGVAHILEGEEKSTLRSTEGTYHFLAPECTTGNEYDPYKVDIWALGVTMFAMLQGTLPFGTKAASLAQVMDSIRDDPLVFAASEDELGLELVDLMRQMMEKDPERRITLAQLRRHPWIVNETRVPSRISVVEVTDQEIEAAFTPVNNFILMARLKIKMAGRLAKAKRNLKRSVDELAASPLSSPTREIPVLLASEPKRLAASSVELDQPIDERTPELPIVPMVVLTEEALGPLRSEMIANESSSSPVYPIESSPTNARPPRRSLKLPPLDLSTLPVVGPSPQDHDSPVRSRSPTPTNDPSPLPSSPETVTSSPLSPKRHSFSLQLQERETQSIATATRESQDDATASPLLTSPRRGFKASSPRRKTVTHHQSPVLVSLPEVASTSPSTVEETIETGEPSSSPQRKRRSSREGASSSRHTISLTGSNAAAIAAAAIATATASGLSSSHDSAMMREPSVMLQRRKSSIPSSTTPPADVSPSKPHQIDIATIVVADERAPLTVSSTKTSPTRSPLSRRPSGSTPAASNHLDRLGSIGHALTDCLQSPQLEIHEQTRTLTPKRSSEQLPRLLETPTAPTLQAPESRSLPGSQPGSGSGSGLGAPSSDSISTGMTARRSFLIMRPAPLLKRRSSLRAETSAPFSDLSVLQPLQPSASTAHHTGGVFPAIDRSIRDADDELEEHMITPVSPAGSSSSSSSASSNNELPFQPHRPQKSPSQSQSVPSSPRGMEPSFENPPLQHAHYHPSPTLRTIESPSSRTPRIQRKSLDAQSGSKRSLLVAQDSLRNLLVGGQSSRRNLLAPTEVASPPEVVNTTRLTTQRSTVGPSRVDLTEQDELSSDKQGPPLNTGAAKARACRIM